MNLFINACIRSNSRTLVIAKALMNKSGETFKERKLLDYSFPRVDEEYINNRDKLISEGRFDSPLFELAREFASADEIIVAAPFWDLSFPSLLKQYFEIINVIGITFVYSSEGIPLGLCKAKKLTYVTSAGGDYFPEEFGYGYIKALAQNFYGISDVRLISARGLDIDGANEAEIIKKCIDGIE